MTPIALARPTTFLRDLGPSPALGHVGPNWFAAVMGTGIVSVAASGLPVDAPVLRVVAMVFWLLSVAVLVAVVTATALHWVHHPAAARGHLHHPVMAHFHGAPAMGLMTVGAATLLLFDHPLAVGLDVVLWTAGTLLGLATAIAVPVATFARDDVAADEAFGGWLMPIVPPMVSAATGALLVPHLPAGEARQTMLLLCYAMVGLTLVASLIVIAMIWARLTQHGVGALGAVPTLWIVLGPLGQSVTAVHHLGVVAPDVLPAPYADGFAALALVAGVPLWGFAMLWLAIATTLTRRAVRQGMPFSLTWWSFTFPVGTLVTGTSGLAALTGSVLLTVVAVALFIVLVAAWAVVAARTTAGVWSGRLLRPA